MSQLKDFETERFKRWKESVNTNPSVVRYAVKPLSNLVENASKRKVLREALLWYLNTHYEAWRAKFVRIDSHLHTMQVSKNALGDDLRGLNRRKEEVLKKLKQQDAELKKCEDEDEKLKNAIHQCTMELKAFKTSLIA